MIRAVLLDLDGTLIDSNESHARAWAEALGEAEINVNPTQVRPLIGMGGDKIIPLLAGVSEDSPLGKTISKRRSEVFRKQYLPQLKAFPGARELVQKMAEDHFQLVVASSASLEDLKGILEILQIERFLTSRNASIASLRSKPSADIVAKALAHTDANPQEALMLGDTPYDILAAAKAGVRTLAFTCGGWKALDLSMALGVYEGPWHLLAEYKTSALSGNFAKQIHVRPEGLPSFH